MEKKEKPILTEQEKHQITKFVSNFTRIHDQLNSVEKEINKLQQRANQTIMKLEDHRREVTEWMKNKAIRKNLNQKEFETICETFYFEKLQSS